MKFHMHDIVALVGDVADDGARVPKGSLGVIIAEYPSGKYYEVEFRTKGNRTFAVSTVMSENLSLIQADPRKLQAVD